MLEWWNEIVKLAPAEFLGYFIAVVLGSIVSWTFSLLYMLRFREWWVEVLYTADPERFPEQSVVKRKISSSKVRELLSEISDRALFVKGVVSPYGWIGNDPLETEGFITIPRKKWGLFWPKAENRILLIRPHKDRNFRPSDTLKALVPQRQESQPIPKHSKIRTDTTVSVPLLARQKQHRNKLRE